VGPLGLTLLVLVLFAAACSPPVQNRVSLGSDVTIWIESPHAKVTYPHPAKVRVTIRNSGTRPFTLAWPPAFRPGAGCGGEAARGPVELWFRGETFDKGYAATPFRWHWRSPSTPATLVIPPLSSRTVIDATFVPPRGVEALHGSFCAYVYGYGMSGGSRYPRPGR
jgi:hypothetical protein